MTKKTNTRKRPREEEEAEHSYARRLVHQCRKDLHKQAKICRNFECQRLSRKLKQGHNNKESQIMILLQRWRHLPLDPVLDLCFRRLGMIDLVQMAMALEEEDDNSNKANKKKKINDMHHPTMVQTATENSDKKNTDTDEKEDDKELHESMFEKILGQKKMRDSMEVWSVKVAEYRKWCARQQQRTFVDDDNNNNNNKNKKSASKATNDDDDDDEITNQPIDASHSLFMTLGNQDDGTKTKKKKKNRPGQKARQAKAAESAGKSSNEHKVRLSSRDKRMAAEEVLHPSWEARKAQKVTITPFQGKKITFDSDTTEKKNHHDVKNKSNSETNLHPSWEARKTQKDGIVAFQGKKITFN